MKPRLLSLIGILIGVHVVQSYGAAMRRLHVTNKNTSNPFKAVQPLLEPDRVDSTTGDRSSTIYNKRE